MQWIVIVSILAFMIALYRWSLKASKKEVNRGPETTEMVQDPNCETYVPETEAVRATIDGRDYRFCSEKCAEEYRNKRSAV